MRGGGKKTGTVRLTEKRLSLKSVGLIDKETDIEDDCYVRDNVRNINRNPLIT
jgi:hypothetical protein